jgi:hypothetical protein
LRYDITNQTVNQYIVGASYVDDCFIIAANYITDYAYTSTSYDRSPITASCCRSACARSVHHRSAPLEYSPVSE